jgi:hypothetical protein
MVSNLKSETARANGAKSRGPTTAEGKEKSSRNAIKHGLTAGTGNILLDCEDPLEFDESLDKLLAIHEPATPAETDIVEEMVAARWRIRRMWTIETNLLNVEVLAQQSKTDSPVPGIPLAMAFRTLADDSRSLALASRYEARLQRLYDRAYKTLRELQLARKSEPPAQPHTIIVRWVDKDEDPGVSDGASPEPSPSTEPELPNEPTATEPRASASGQEVPNEPTVAANEEPNDEPASVQHPFSPDLPEAA